MEISDCTRNIVIYFEHKYVTFFEGLVSPNDEIVIYQLPQKNKKEYFFNNIENVLKDNKSFKTWQISNFYTNIKPNLNMFEKIRMVLRKNFKKDFINLEYRENLSLEELSDYYTDFNNRLIGEDFVYYCPYATDNDKNTIVLFPKKIKSGLISYDNNSFTPEKNSCYKELVPILYFLKNARTNMRYEVIDRNYDPEFEEFKRMERERELNPFGHITLEEVNRYF